MDGGSVSEPTAAAHSLVSHLLTTVFRVELLVVCNYNVKKGKGFPYSTPSVGPGVDPGVQAVSLQVTVSLPPGGMLPLLSARPAVTSPLPSRRASPPFGRYQVILLGDRGT